MGGAGEKISPRKNEGILKEVQMAIDVGRDLGGPTPAIWNNPEGSAAEQHVCQSFHSRWPWEGGAVSLSVPQTWSREDV